MRVMGVKKLKVKTEYILWIFLMIATLPFIILFAIKLDTSFNYYYLFVNFILCGLFILGLIKVSSLEEKLGETKGK